MEQNRQNETTMTGTSREGTPRIYVASLADYNAGVLLGRWIDADQGVQAIHDQIDAMLATSKQPVRCSPRTPAEA